MSNDQSVFSFELNESLFFEKGQEVAEMRGISLDPEISVRTFNEYISIVGKIELRGEYKKVFQSEEEPISDFTDYHAKRYVEKVVDTVNNVATFSHWFPVEISVPSYRVSDINDITVDIETFDYEIPEASQLKLYATIDIYGINSEIEAPPVRKIEEDRNEVTIREEADVKDEEYLQELEKETDSPKQEVRTDENMAPKLAVRDEESKEEVQEKVSETIKEEINVEETEVRDEESVEDEANEKGDTFPEEKNAALMNGEMREEIPSHGEQEELAEKEERVAEEQVESMETGDAFEFEIKEKPKKESIEQKVLLDEDHPPALASESEVEEDSVERDRWKYKQVQTLAEFFNKLPSQELETDSPEMTDITSSSASIEIEADSPEVYESSSQRVKDVTYLSDMFRDSEEHQFAKMRLCIVQNQDTIETIAERYHISALQLIKQNHLDDDYTVEEGQLLYIPDQKKN